MYIEKNVHKVFRGYLQFSHNATGTLDSKSKIQLQHIVMKLINLYLLKYKKMLKNNTKKKYMTNNAYKSPNPSILKINQA